MPPVMYIKLFNCFFESFGKCLVAFLVANGIEPFPTLALCEDVYFHFKTIRNKFSVKLFFAVIEKKSLANISVYI